MKLSNTALAVLTTASSVYAHATWQQLWVNGADQGGACARLPINNNPISTTEGNIRCGSGGSKPAAAVCSVAAGGTVTIEMHQQPGDRNCKNEAIGGNHDGPVIAYLGRVADAKRDSGSSWFKIYENGLVRKDYWGTDVINANCGKQDIKIPADIAPGDYLLRTEVIALHVAGSSGGAQHYVSCFQLQVTGSGNASPSGVAFPGAYSPSDPGILFNLYSSYTTYKVPGPPVYAGGAGPGPEPTGVPQPTSSDTPEPTSSAPVGNIKKYQQCGGTNWQGAGYCEAGTTCVKQNDYYSQCL